MLKKLKKKDLHTVSLIKIILLTVFIQQHTYYEIVIYLLFI